jgi:NADH:ubiquinone oxidoreductase subunit 4 (subunit M)
MLYYVGIEQVIYGKSIDFVLNKMGRALIFISISKMGRALVCIWQGIDFY